MVDLVNVRARLRTLAEGTATAVAQAEKSMPAVLCVLVAEYALTTHGKFVDVDPGPDISALAHAPHRHCVVHDNWLRLCEWCVPGFWRNSPLESDAWPHLRYLEKRSKSLYLDGQHASDKWTVVDCGQDTAVVYLTDDAPVYKRDLLFVPCSRYCCHKCLNTDHSTLAAWDKVDRCVVALHWPSMRMRWKSASLRAASSADSPVRLHAKARAIVVETLSTCTVLSPFDGAVWATVSLPAPRGESAQQLYLDTAQASLVLVRGDKLWLCAF